MRSGGSTSPRSTRAAARTVAAVGPQRGAACGAALYHRDRRLALRASIRFGEFHVHHQAVPVLRQQVTHVAERRFLPRPLAVEPRVGVGGAGVGVASPLLPPEVDLQVAPAPDSVS